ncbi:MAG: bifunctional ornithine acetyltransferase/N-acetylglutamate synthase, partial [Armatimonadota bacterium]|nr:bifunctional ornithine acetyltransferase/N-acetylglutamate synthase [Armatimonadota bacterium]
AGMVAPRMATVFGFFVTDAAIEPSLLQTIFSRVMDRTINRVTVDGDTSTNDTACILASGGSGISRITPDTPDTPAAEQFEAGLSALAERLARKLARDGEGANHLITVRVKGTRDEADAETIALSIANSPLVKTAIFGRDANWGRIAMAAGRAGIPFDQERVDIFLNGIAVARAGMRQPFDETQMRAQLEQDEITIEVHLNAGDGEAVAWTCDFSYDYVKINAEYHT